MARILVVDDEPSVRMAILKELTRVGHEVLTAESGKEALEIAVAETPDLVIADIVMPEMDGLELMLALRQRLPELPLLAVSGGGLVDKDLLLGMADALGAHAILQKPLESDRLQSAVNRLLET